MFIELLKAVVLGIVEGITEVASYQQYRSYDLVEEFIRLNTS